MSKTIREWLNELEEPYKTQAIENTIKFNNGIDNAVLDHTVPALPDAIKGAFIWIASPEGHDYWAELRNKYSNLGE